jgi:hypothetical protein
MKQTEEEAIAPLMESRERRTRAALPVPAARVEGDLEELSVGARCPACRFVLVPQVARGRVGFGCGCGLSGM